MTSDIEFIIQQKLILIRHVLYLDNDWILLRTNCFSFCFPLDYYCDWHYLYTVITGHIGGAPTQVTSKPGHYMYNCGRIQEKALHFEDCSLSCHNSEIWEPTQLVVGSLNRTHPPTLTTTITYSIQHERKIIITNALKNHLKRWHGTHQYCWNVHPTPNYGPISLARSKCPNYHSAPAVSASAAASCSPTPKDSTPPGSPPSFSSPSPVATLVVDNKYQLQL